MSGNRLPITLLILAGLLAYCATANATEEQGQPSEPVLAVEKMIAVYFNVIPKLDSIRVRYFAGGTSLVSAAQQADSMMGEFLNAANELDHVIKSGGMRDIMSEIPQELGQALMAMMANREHTLGLETWRMELWLRLQVKQYGMLADSIITTEKDVAAGNLLRKTANVREAYLVARMESIGDSIASRDTYQPFDAVPDTVLRDQAKLLQSHMLRVLAEAPESVPTLDYKKSVIADDIKHRLMIIYNALRNNYEDISSVPESLEQVVQDGFLDEEVIQTDEWTFRLMQPAQVVARSNEAMPFGAGKEIALFLEYGTVAGWGLKD